MKIGHIQEPLTFNHHPKALGKPGGGLWCWRNGIAVILTAGMALAAAPAFAAERDEEAAKEAALGHSEDEVAAPRPSKLPDLTKGEVIPPDKKVGIKFWNLGPTGIIGTPNAWYDGDQVQVLAILPGSPAEGKVIPGDVVMGVQGTDFVAGGHLGISIGNAIIKAEEEAGQGRLTLHLWRDLNWTKRVGPKDVLGIDIDELMGKADDAQLYEWEGEEERDVSVKRQGYDDFPIDGMHTNVTLQLELMGTYSDTSPWKCPVADKIREGALEVIATGFRPDKKGQSRGDWPGVLALVASGKPEYVELAKSWVHKQKVCQDMNLQTTLYDMSYKGMQSWAAGFEALEQAIYYDATGDEFILPEIRKRAIWTAMGQSGGGSWGHTFSFPEVNGGELHKRNPGYGGMNNAGGRCFFLLALAKKFGIKHPEIDLALDRAGQFFWTYVDKGCIPYGDHMPWPSDDSNGKNYGPAYALNVLGKPYEAKYFSMHSAHAAFSRRGGHGSATLWYYTPLSATIAGPKAVMASMRNMRWFYTLSRRHDGSFVFQGDQRGIGGRGMRAPTETHAIYYSVPLQKLILTGKGADSSWWVNDQELEDLLISARSQITDPLLLKGIGKPWQERDTDALIALLHHFFPVLRRNLAKELGRRFAAGETDIPSKVLPLLASPEARTREGACLTLTACGTDTVLANLSGIAKLLNDKAEFVRMTAISTIAGATKPGDSKRELMLLKMAAGEYPDESCDIANVVTACRAAIFSGDKKKDAEQASKMGTTPFEAGYDRDLVRSALEKMVTMDPGGGAPLEWTRETLVELAGPVVFIADEMQLMDKMFSVGRLLAGRQLLAKYGYREAVEADVVNLLKRTRLERNIRENVGFVHGGASGFYGILSPIPVEARPGAYRRYLAPMKQWLQDDPLAEPTGVGADWIARSVGLNVLIKKIEADSQVYELPSLASDVAALFEKDLASKGDAAAKTKFCRDVLANHANKDFFRKMAALTQLAGLVGPEAVNDAAAYLGDAQWRLREHAHNVALGLAKNGAAERLAACLASVQGENAAGVLFVLAEAGNPAVLKTVSQALQHREGVVRRAAVQALMALGGDKALLPVLTFMEKTTDADDLWGCEQALLSRREDAAFCQRVRSEALARLANSTVPVRRSLAFVLAQLGGEESLAALQAAAAKSEDPKDVRNIVKALSYSPDRGADQVMLALAKVDRMRLDAVAAESVRRMVGPNGMDNMTDRQRVDFAKAVLDMKLEDRLIRFLGKVHTGRSIQLLFEVMKNTDRTVVAAQSIISAVDGMEKPPEDEAKIAADALAQVIEYIEVTRLRGGMAAHMDKDDKYLEWKEIQARAGKAMLKVHKPQKAPIPTFDAMQLDM